MERKIALVTGANKGIGLEIARQLSSKGLTVIIGARDPKLGADAAESLRTDGRDVHFVQLEVTDGASVRAAAATVEEQFGRLDVLVNNAGIFIDFGTPVAETPFDIARKTFDVNVFGTWDVTQAFLSLIRKSDAGRIVNVSSTLGSIAEIGNSGSPYDQMRSPAYQVSKSALNSLTTLFARELRDTPIKVNAVCPGYVNSGAPGTEHATRTVEQGARIAVEMALLPVDGPNGGFFDDNGVIPW